MIFNGRKIRDITGVRSGKLVAIRPVNPIEKYGNEGRKQVLWECRCDCGELAIHRATNIAKGVRKSCGCMMVGGRSSLRRGDQIRKDKLAAHALCGDVPLWYFRNMQYKAGKRGFCFDVSVEYLNDLYQKQGRRCSLSGRLLEFRFRGKDIRGMTASLDRIDSSLGYVEGNLQWVHKVVNMEKKTMNNAEFIEWCGEIWEMARDVAEKKKATGVFYLPYFWMMFAM
jgi:hypothetical protein